MPTSVRSILGTTGERRLPADLSGRMIMSVPTSNEYRDSVPGPIVLHSADVDEAVAGVSSVLHPHELNKFTAGAHFQADLKAIVTPDMTCGKLRYSGVSDLYCPYISGVHVNLPLAGRLLSISGGRQTNVDHGTGIVYDTDSDARLLTSADSAPFVLALKVTRSVVHTTLEDMLGRPVAEPVRLGGAIDLTHPDGRAWRTVLLAMYQSQTQGSFWTNAHLAEPVRYLVLAGLLNLAHHQYSDDLADPWAPVSHVSIRRAVDFINVDPSAALTPLSIAREVGLSVRALQRGFRKYMQITPTEYIRSIRMKGAHEALTEGDPATHTVAAIASRWGFTHYGRFASDYRRRYGISPSETLQRPAKTAPRHHHS